MRNAIIFAVALVLSLLMLDFCAYAAPRARNGAFHVDLKAL